MITLDCLGKKEKHFMLFIPNAGVPANKKQNPQLVTHELSHSRILYYLEKHLVPNRLYIVYDIGDSRYRHFSSEYLFSQIQKLIIDNFSHCNDCYFICRDPSTFQDHDILDNLEEFKFYNMLCKWKKPKKFTHPQLIESDYPLCYSDLTTEYWIELARQKKFNLPKKNVLFKHKLSCLVNTARYPRSVFITLIYDLDVLLSHKAALHDVTLELSSKLDESLRSKLIENYSLAKNKFSKNQHWSSAKTYTKTATEQSLKMIQQSFCNIAIEDPVYSKFTRITEKICKPIVSYRPFLLLAAPNTLAWLKNNGFRTFDKWWDESYDVEQNHLLRIQAVYRVAQYINSLSKKECQKILDEMQPILEHNQQHLFQFQSLLHKEIIS